ncbi:MAG: SPOR domain-containing protein [Pseudomonadota bacterium]
MDHRNEKTSAKMTGQNQFNPRGYDMERKILNRNGGRDLGPKLALLASAAIATATLTACTTASVPEAQVSFNKAQTALEKGQTTKAVTYAEAAVLAEPRNANYRSLLGAAYLDEGRYASAAQSFADALELGDTNSRTVLSYALTSTALGNGKGALKELRDWESALDPADAGLALALAGNPERGVFVLTNALRAGQNTAKIRQNLAYTYALAGNWRAARVMAAEDVPADKLDARLSDWAQKARPEDHMVRVSTLLGIQPVSDGGLPTRLALANFPSAKDMVAEAEAAKPVDKAPAQVAKAPGSVTQAEAIAFKRDAQGTGVKSVDPTAERVAAAPKKPVATPISAPVAKPSPKPAAPRFVSRPVTQQLPQPSAATSAPKPAAKRVAQAPTPAQTAPAQAKAPAPAGDTHMVQLGSYVSEAEAKRGWTTLKGKFPQLAKHDVVITKAEVKGKTYYRVAAAGFGRQGAAQLCSTVKSAGRGCFAYSKNNPPKGAVDKGTRIAAAR